jgi:nitrous oxidase accessory protein NosD
MKSSFEKKSLAFAIIVLFSGISIIPSMVAERPVLIETIYVDDDNTDGPWDGSIVHPYQHVEDALDVAENGSTVFVCNGTYYGKFRVDKSIKLQGEHNRETFLWEECFHVLYIESSDVEISGFTILGNYSTQSGIGFEDYNDNVIENVSIHDNRIIHHRTGIQSYHPSTENKYFNKNIKIYDNEIIGNNQGISFQGNLVNISGNTISGNRYYGMSILGNDIEINNNLICYNEQGIIPQGDNIHIYHNEILDNENDGIQCSSSLNGTISNNLISDNNHGICFQKNSDGNSDITRNYLIGNQIGLFSEKTSSALNVFRNEISRNELFGMVICKKINGAITENNFIDNGKNNEKCRLPLLKRHALFIGVFRLTQSPFNSNYWDNYKGGGKFYIPAIGVLPGFLKDFNPVTQPYDVS